MGSQAKAIDKGLKRDRVEVGKTALEVQKDLH